MLQRRPRRPLPDTKPGLELPPVREKYGVEIRADFFPALYEGRIYFPGRFDSQPFQPMCNHNHRALSNNPAPKQGFDRPGPSRSQPRVTAGATQSPRMVKPSIGRIN